MNRRFLVRTESLGLEISGIIGISCLLAIGLKAVGFQGGPAEILRLIGVSAIVAPASLYIWLKCSGRIRLLKPRMRS